MDRLVRDVRVALRGLRRQATFTVTAVLVLGLGIGMATAMWVVFNAALLHRLPVGDEDRIVLPRTLDRAGTDVAMPDRELDEARRESRTMRDMAGVGDWGAYDFPFLNGDQPIHLGQADVTSNFFDVLGVRPVLGRLLGSQDDSASRVLVLSYGAWRRRFGGDPSIIGHHLTQPGTGWTFTIVGVAPPGLDFPAGTDCWTPLEATFYSVDIVARLAPGASPRRRVPSSWRPWSASAHVALRASTLPEPTSGHCARRSPEMRDPRSSSSRLPLASCCSSHA